MLNVSIHNKNLCNDRSPTGYKLIYKHKKKKIIHITFSLNHLTTKMFQFITKSLNRPGGFSGSFGWVWVV